MGGLRTLEGLVDDAPPFFYFVKLVLGWDKGVEVQACENLPWRLLIKRTMCH